MYSHGQVNSIDLTVSITANIHLKTCEKCKKCIFILQYTLNIIKNPAKIKIRIVTNEAWPTIE